MMAVSEASMKMSLNIRMSERTFGKVLEVAKDNNLKPGTFVRKLVEQRLGIVEELLLPHVPSHESPRRRRR